MSFGSNTISLIQADLQAQLAADEYFAGIPVLLDEADTESKVNRILGVTGEEGEACGLCAIILQPTGSHAGANAPGAPLDLTFAVRILENPTLNRDLEIGTSKTAIDAARRVCRVLGFYQAVGLCTPLRPGQPYLVPVLNEVVPSAYDVRFTTREATLIVDKVAPPMFSQGAEITITCATAGAAIYYTTNASHPNPSNTAATLYTAPFTTPAAGTIIRAGAFKTGSIASDINLLEV